MTVKSYFNLCLISDSISGVYLLDSGTLLHVCKTFENLLMASQPRLFVHLLSIGVQPLQVLQATLIAAAQCLSHLDVVLIEFLRKLVATLM